MTKSALAREAQQADVARKDFLARRDAVKATDISIPFVFYDGTNIPGGRCRLKKGDNIWLFLDKARKVGAELGVGGDKGKREWARVSIDDLMLVRGEVILPHVRACYCSWHSHTDVFGSITTFTTSFSTKLQASTAPFSTTLPKPPRLRLCPQRLMRQKLQSTIRSSDMGRIKTSRRQLQRRSSRDTMRMRR